MFTSTKEDFPPYVTISENAVPTTTKKDNVVYETISEEVVSAKLNSCQLICLLMYRIVIILIIM